MKLGSWKQAWSQRHVTAQFSLGHISGISLLKYPVVLHNFPPPPPQTELINVRLLVIMEREGETRMEKLLYINLCIINMLVIQLYTVFYSTIYHHTSRKAVSG